jgi:integration host factor subunit alpha
MNLNKAKIIKNIAKNAMMSNNDSSILFENFISIIKYNSKFKTIKLSRFGTFFYKKSPKRIGRNPKTKESYIISERNKLGFKASSYIKEILNL